MSRIKITLGLKDSRIFFKPIFTMVLTLLLISILAGCETPPAATHTPNLVAPTTTTVAVAKPQGELVTAVSFLGNENFLPWKGDMGSSYMSCLVYDMLIYYDLVNNKFIPGLAESWEVSSDALTLTYHLRKGVQFQDGWGELTSEDVKYNFEKQAETSSVGKTSTRSIKSMDTLDPYTLVLHFKTRNPTFLGQFSSGEGGSSQGIVSKKYVETVGETVASQKPIGTGPYKMVESQFGSYYKFEALDSHWRVIPEFKNLNLRVVPEVSTQVAMLKTGEIDLTQVPAEQMASLEADGMDTEVNSSGGSILQVIWGGVCLKEDKRYNQAYHDKDPWVDSRVRKAMAISIDRQAICNAIFAGGATPTGAVMFSTGMGKYQYPYDPAAARQLLKDAGYPDGFSFEAVSYVYTGVPETPRVMEALVSYWEQIGLDPKITALDFSAFNALRTQLKTANMIAIARISETSDQLDRASIFLAPDAPAPYFMDEGSYALIQEGSTKVDPEERALYVEKLNQYYFENVGPIPLFVIGVCYAWNPDKISPFPHPASGSPLYLEYVRHAQPLNTFRLFTPWPGR